MRILKNIILEKAIVIVAESQLSCHIPEPPGGTDAPITLCGWSGENFRVSQNEIVDCPDCLRVAHYCQTLPPIDEHLT